MTTKSRLYKFLFEIPYFGKKLKLIEPGYYYSTIPGIEVIKKRSASIFSKSEESIKKNVNLIKQFLFVLRTNDVGIIWIRKN